MADAAARREARRRRILENSENRLSKITGRYNENSTNETSKNDITYPVLQGNNGVAASKSIFADENKVLLEEKQRDFLERNDGSGIPEFELSEPSTPFQPTDNHFTFDHTDHRYLLKEDRENCDNSKFTLKENSVKQSSSEKSRNNLLIELFFNPVFSIFLAAFVNILILSNVNMSLHKGILMPYLIMAVSRLCLGNKSDESEDRSMLIAALILCNVKAEILHNLKRIIVLCSTVSRDFALYLTSFILINWVLSICWSDIRLMQFS